MVGLWTLALKAIELAHAYDMSWFGLLFEFRAWYAAPSLFATARVAIPGSILGAVLAEWLLTGGGRTRARRVKHRIVLLNIHIQTREFREFLQAH